MITLEGVIRAPTQYLLWWIIALLVLAASPSSQLTVAEVIKNDFRVNSDSTNYTQLGYSVGFDGKGNFIVTYQDNGFDNKNHQIHFQRFDSTGQHMGQPVLASDTLYQNSAADIAVHPSGRFVITWWRQDTSTPMWEDDIFARIFDSLGNPISPRLQVDVDRPTIREDEWSQNSYPRVGMDSVGNFVIVWQSQDSTGHNIYGQRFSEKGERLGKNFLISTRDHSQQEYAPVYPNAQFPNLSVAPDGRIAVVWGDYLGAYLAFTPMVRFYDSSGKPLTKVRSPYLPDIEAKFGSNPDVQRLKNRTFAVCWSGNDPKLTYPNGGIFVKVLDSLGNYVSEVVAVNDTLDLRSSLHNCFIAADDAGDFIIIWSDERGETSASRNLWAQKFDSQANKMGTNFRINSLPNSLGSNWSGYALDIYKERIVIYWTDWRNYETYGPDIYCRLIKTNLAVLEASR